MLGDQEDPENFFEDEEDSPYPEVRASVSNYDDPEMPCLTFRAMLLGVSFTLLGAAANTYFYLRYPAPLLTPIVVQIITYPLGAGLARIMPVTLFDTPKWLQKLGAPTYWSLNPGPFNIKEHTVIIIMANVGIAPSFTQSMLLALDKFYEVKTGFGYDILLLLSVNTVGFTFAGFCRRFLIWPAALIWPQTLVTCTLLNTFHAEDDDAGTGSLTRYRYFLYVFFGALVWYIVPGYLFIGLSAFSWVCWIAPTNPVVNQLFGVVTGLGMSSITFDWSQVAYIGSPLIVPWWAIANIFVGFIVLIWLFAPIMYYTNTWDLAYLPISVNAVFDRYGYEYNVTAVLTPDLKLDQEAYAAYSPMYFPSTYTAIYALAFALATSSLVHTVLYYGPTMWQTFRDIKKAKRDIHAKLMSAYPDVPTWWYAITFVACAAFSIGFVEGYSTGLPVWGLVLAALVVAVYIIPGGYIYALSSQALTVNIIAEIIPSYLFRGQPIVNMLFKAFTVNTLQLGLYYIQDLKLGHYMKVPPRVTFSIQITATVLAAFIQAGMKEGLLKGVPDLCAADQAAGLSCPTTRAIFNSSIVWGLIGAKRIFGDGSPYSALLWALLVGAALPCLFWVTSRYYKARWIRLVNIPVMLSGLVLIPQATGLNHASWFIFGFVFQFLLRRYRFRWWSKFSFITSAGLDSGTVISTLLVFFALQLPKNGGLRLNWWGNLVYRNTYDWLGYPYKIP
ncbi:putative oligopeptide transporter [Cystobasidium minutum MCA 4210]|uniref:putative oligopeptide transporter n=1 Tax=Cystobasidium minutum MCA 4210 TaxID=1397322 RepID=UPI0034CEA8A0|eukprot:jgi/Rhomi1/144581/e_gw1.4.424.1